MMFQVGNPGGPGRKSGPVKVGHILKEFGIDPVIELIKIAMKKETSDGQKTKIYQDLMGYLYPKLKQMALTDIEGNTLPQSIQVVMPAMPKKDE